MEEEKKDSFVFFRSFYEAILDLPKDNQTEILLAICEYSLNGVIPEDLSPIGRAVFIVIKPNIDNASKRYKASVENGKKGGRPKKNNNLEKPNNNLEKPNNNLEKPNNNLEKPNNNLDETKPKPNQNLNVDVDVDVDDNVNDNIINIETKKKASTELENEFEEIWSMYPKKQGKTNALKSYIKARKKGVDKETIWYGLGNYIDYIKASKTSAQYIKQGSTWFNQECWNDDYTVIEKKQNNNQYVKQSGGNPFFDLLREEGKM